MDEGLPIDKMVCLDSKISSDTQWPDFRMYWPTLHDLIFDDGRDQHLLARIDYGLVPSSHDSAAPSLEALGIVNHKRLGPITKPEVVEAIVGYWLALAPQS
jgi:hypothetical protein